MQTIIGVFSSADDAENLVDELEIKGYNSKEMSIIAKDNAHLYKKVGSKGGAVTSGAVSGATAGGVIGGLAGLLIGLGAIAIPGIGGLLIGGPLAAALGLTGAAATTVSGATTGILAGGLVGGLVALGIPEDVARVYEERVREGAVLLAVPVKGMDQAHEVRDMFTRHQAAQVRTLDQLARRTN